MRDIPQTGPFLADHARHGELALLAFRDEEGSLANRYFRAISSDGAPAPAPEDSADLAHYLTLLHGRYPGVIDHAADRHPASPIKNWLDAARDGFAAERVLLTRLTVAAGPIHATVGEDQCTAVILDLRDAFEKLSQSDRIGCALGSAFALVLDWHAIRPRLEDIARRNDCAVRPTELPTAEETLDAAARAAENDRILRALHFGASQLFRQHRLFWQMLEARRDARAHR